MKRSDRLLALLFPPRCASCNQLLDWYEAGRSQTVLCPTCQKEWDEACRDECGICHEKLVNCRCFPEALSHARAKELSKLVYYRSGTSTAVSNRILFCIKHKRDRRTLTWLAMQMQPHVERIADQVGKENAILTYAPRSGRAIREFGTDQARELAKTLSRLVGIDTVRAIGRTQGSSLEQKTLSAKQRSQNAKKSYKMLPKTTETVAGRSVILIDDIVTTGATTAECVRLLKKAGALEVYCLAVATDDVNRDAALLPKRQK